MTENCQLLSAQASNLLFQLFLDGPTEDAHIGSPLAREELEARAFLDRAAGWQWLTTSGVGFAFGLGFDQKKLLITRRLRPARR